MAEGNAPAVEGADIGDSDIINWTTQEEVGGDSMKLKATLPDGFSFESEAFKIENRAAALRQWLEIVRQTVISRAQAAADRAARGARGSILSPEEIAGMAGHAPQNGAPTPQTGYAAQHPIDKSLGRANTAGVADPAAFIAGSVEAAGQAVAEAAAQVAFWQAKKKAAEAALVVWQRMLEVSQPRRRRRRVTPSTPSVAPSIAAGTSSGAVEASVPPPDRTVVRRRKRKAGALPDSPPQSEQEATGK